MQAVLKKGLLITIEGVEGVGKSSAIKYLEQYLHNLNLDFILTREPGGTEIAEIIRQVILQPHHELMSCDTELLLIFASRAQHLANLILPALARGQIVVSDRFTDATYAYQGAGRKIPKHRIAALEEWIQGTLQPDLTIMLDAPIHVGLERILSRGVKDRIEQEQVDFFCRVREAYLDRAREFPDRFRIIDATQPIAQVQKNLQKILGDFLAAHVPEIVDSL